MGQSEECVVYIILCNVGTMYTGITKDLIKRWQQHNDRKSYYLKLYRPLEVVYVECCESRQAAARKGRKIKSIGAKKYMLKLKYRKWWLR